MEKKWNFKIPEQGPSKLQVLKFAINRAGNNIKYGFDGSMTPLQLGSQLDHSHLVSETEIMLLDMVVKNDIVGLIKGTFKKGLPALKNARTQRKLEDLKG